MAEKRTDEELRLYAWVRVFGAVLLLVTIVLMVLGILILPLLDEDYDVPEGTVVAVLGLLLTSTLALVNVTAFLRRNGDNNGKSGG